jgi:aconitase A
MELKYFYSIFLVIIFSCTNSTNKRNIIKSNLADSTSKIHLNQNNDTVYLYVSSPQKRQI